MNRIHPLSVLLGLALTGICFVTMSQVPVLSTSNVRIEYMPHPRDMVQIQEGTPYAVPAGRILVVTGLGAANQYATNGVVLLVNGTQELNLSYPTGFQGPSIHSVPGGFTAPAGSLVSVVSAFQESAEGPGDISRACSRLAPIAADRLLRIADEQDTFARSLQTKTARSRSRETWSMGKFARHAATVRF